MHFLLDRAYTDSVKAGIRLCRLRHEATGARL
jgi:hypothetical protein